MTDTMPPIHLYEHKASGAVVSRERTDTGPFYHATLLKQHAPGAALSSLLAGKMASPFKPAITTGEIADEACAH